ncbi:alpha/beta hydrolase [Salinigranum sp.]|uniref:alpha/beta hydrolase n=1 Tax=Salinigranum sp. TaxID=1966351 RepID=UPI003568561B
MDTIYSGWTERMAADPEMDLRVVREMFETGHLAAAEPERATYAEVDAGGIPALWCIPEDCASDRVLLYCHGGGYMVGSMHLSRKVAAHIAKTAGIRALVIDYRLAPEHPHPAPVEDAVTAYRWLTSEEIRPEHIATCGDSAGGNLCTAMVLKLRDEGDPLPAAIVPMAPWYDMEMTGESLDSNAATDSLVNREMVEVMAATFLGDGSPTDPLANILRADLTGLPPVLIHVSTTEALVDDTRRFAARAEESGVDVTVEAVPDVPHVYPYMAGRDPEADRAVERMGEWVRPRLGLE